MKVALTGRPGVGKTTACLKVFGQLKPRVAGFVTTEVRENKKRVGFKLKDLRSGEEVWLAKIGDGKPKVGKYVVFVENLEKFLDNLDLHAEILIVDEVGPMELKSQKFVEFIEDEIFSREKVLVTVHYKASHPLAEKIRREFRLFVIDEENREKVVEEILKSL